MNKIIKLTRLYHHDNNDLYDKSNILFNVDFMIKAELNPYLCCTSIVYKEDSVKTIECAESIETIMQLINQKNY